MFDFSNQIVVVTGARGNLGSAVARRFLAAGATLALVDHAGDGLRAAFADLADSPDHLLLGDVDLTAEPAPRHMVAQVIDRFGRIDVLANTVGGFRAGDPVHDTPLDTFEFMLSLNARTAFILGRAVVPVMLRQGGGKIIHTAAPAGEKGRKHSAAYSASKAAVIRLTEIMAAELKANGINVNCILPGTIDTPQNREAMPNANFDRWVPPEDLADVFLFLASDAARAIHGAAVPVLGLT